MVTAEDSDGRRQGFVIDGLPGITIEIINQNPGDARCALPCPGLSADLSGSETGFEKPSLTQTANRGRVGSALAQALGQGVEIGVEQVFEHGALARADAHRDPHAREELVALAFVLEIVLLGLD